MKILGFEIKRVQKELPPIERMKLGCDIMNAAWREHRIEGGRERPWVIWDEGRMVITRYSGGPIVVHE